MVIKPSARAEIFFLQIMVFPLKSPFQTYPFFIIIDNERKKNFTFYIDQSLIFLFPFCI
jgi:hypothetical protein